MKRSVVLDGKEYEMIEPDRVANYIVLASVLAQFTIIILNWTVWKHSPVVTAFLWGIQLITLILAISMCLVTRHNSKIVNMVIKRMEEDMKKREAEKDAKNVKKAPKKPRKNVKKETKDGAK